MSSNDPLTKKLKTCTSPVTDLLLGQCGFTFILSFSFSYSISSSLLFPIIFLSCLYLCSDHFSSFSLPQYASLHTSPQFISLLSVLVTAAGCLLMFSGADKLFHTSNSPLPSSSSPAGILNLLFFLSPTDSVSFCFLFLTTTYRPIIVARTQNTPSTDWLQGMCYFLIYMCV